MTHVLARSGTRGRWMANTAIAVACTIVALWALFGLSILFVDPS